MQNNSILYNESIISKHDEIQRKGNLLNVVCCFLAAPIPQFKNKKMTSRLCTVYCGLLWICMVYAKIFNKDESKTCLFTFLAPTGAQERLISIRSSVHSSVQAELV